MGEVEGNNIIQVSLCVGGVGNEPNSIWNYSLFILPAGHDTCRFSLVNLGEAMLLMLLGCNG